MERESGSGNAGNINIKTEGIFGLKERKSTQENRTNDIDASSQLGFSGNVFINNPDVNPTKGIEQSPKSVVEPDETVSQACSGSDDIAKENSFTIIGRGGMPDDPTKPLNSFAIAGDLKSEVQRGEGAEEKRGRGAEFQGQAIDRDGKKKTVSFDEIIPARGVAVNEKGQVVLTRYPNRNTSDRTLTQSNYCSDRASNNPTFKGYIFSDNYLVGFN